MAGRCRSDEPKARGVGRRPARRCAGDDRLRRRRRPPGRDAHRACRPNPLAAAQLYVDRTAGPAPRQVAQWNREGRRVEAERLQAIARQPVPVWLTGQKQDPYATVRDVTAAARKQGRLPAFVLYNVPGRNCGLYSSGGAADVDAYLSWVGSAAAALGKNKAVFVVEPDAVAQAVSGCLGAERAAGRMSRAATPRSASSSASQAPPSTSTPATPAGSRTPTRWPGPAHQRGGPRRRLRAQRRQLRDHLDQRRLRQVPLHASERDALRRGHQPERLWTSAPGRGTQKEGHRTWCNPAHAHIGTAPTTDTGVLGLDALMWVKQPGDSDGSCHAGAPEAGTWWPSYALKLVD